MGSDSQVKLPNLDFTIEDLKPGKTSWSSACKSVRQAFEDHGCFVATLKSFPLDLHNSVFGALQELFDLPLETKIKITISPYMATSDRFRNFLSMKAWPFANTLKGIEMFTHLMWPEGNDHFCGRVYAYAKLAAELDQMVTRMLFESYGVEKSYDSYIGSTTYYLRLLKNKASVDDKPNLGFLTHTYKSFTTILHQNHVNGLEVETKDGNWVSVDMSSSTSFVVLAGDALMACSNDRIKSPSHRVMVHGDEDRYSLELFTFNDGTIEVPEELVDDGHPLRYKPFNHLGLMHFFRTSEGYNSKCPIKAYCGT